MDQFQQLTKNAENLYYLLKQTSDSYTLQSSHKIGIYVIKSGELVFDAVYLNLFVNYKRWYIPYEKNEGKKCHYKN